MQESFEEPAFGRGGDLRRGMPRITQHGSAATEVLSADWADRGWSTTKELTGIDAHETHEGHERNRLSFFSEIFAFFRVFSGQNKVFLGGVRRHFTSILADQGNAFRGSTRSDQSCLGGS
jgi:hypothetical protein